MNKSEERAFEAYPVCMQELIHIDHTTEFVDANKRDRGIYIEGYKQALADVRGEVEKAAKLYTNSMSGADWRKVLRFIDEQIRYENTR